MGNRRNGMVGISAEKTFEGRASVEELLAAVEELLAARDENRILRRQLQHLQTEHAELRLALASATSASMTDPLTGLANRRAFDAVLTGSVGPGQLMLIDVDHFKIINDSHGHGFGDEMLRMIGEVLTGSVRRPALVARMGGDEFALLLTNSPWYEHAGMQAAVVARRIALRPLAVRGHPERRETVTLSIGVAFWQSGETTDAWYARADTALYEAKRGGRNQAVVAATYLTASHPLKLA